MKKIGMLFALLAGALLAAHARAQMPGQTYFGIGGGVVWTDGASPYFDTPSDDTAAGGKIFFGSLGKSLGWEFGAYYFGKYDVTFGGQNIAESTASALAVSGVYATDIGAGYTFHAKLGIAITQFEIECLALCGQGALTPLNTTKKRGNSGLLGVGFGARITQNLQARMEYEHFGNVHQAVSAYEYKDAYDMVSVSLQLNF